MKEVAFLGIIFKLRYAPILLFLTLSRIKSLCKQSMIEVIYNQNIIIFFLTEVSLAERMECSFQADDASIVD